MRILILFSVFVFKSNKPDCLLHQFVPTHNKVHFIKLSRKVNHYTITALNFYWLVQVAAMYKQKINKIQSVSSFKNDERAPESDSNWQQQIMNAEETADFYQKQSKFNAYFTFKFLNIEEFSQLTQKQVDRLIIDDLKSRKCELLLWMLRNWEKAFAWDYLKMGCLHSNVVVPITIRTVKHKAWQVFNFLISQTLLLKIVEMLYEQKRFRFLKNCNDLYCNSWFLMKKRIIDKYWKMNTATELNKVIK